MRNVGHFISYVASGTFYRLWAYFFASLMRTNHDRCRNEEDTIPNRGNEEIMVIPIVKCTLGKSRLNSKTPLHPSYLE